MYFSILSIKISCFSISLFKDKVKEFDEYKALQANKEFISAQINAKPFMKDLFNGNC